MRPREVAEWLVRQTVKDRQVLHILEKGDASAAFALQMCQYGLTPRFYQARAVARLLEAKVVDEKTIGDIAMDLAMAQQARRLARRRPCTAR